MADYYIGDACGYCQKPITTERAIKAGYWVDRVEKEIILHDGVGTADGAKTISVDGNCNMEWSMKSPDSLGGCTKQRILLKPRPTLEQRV
jgi:hypothetical protein